MCMTSICGVPVELSLIVCFCFAFFSCCGYITWTIICASKVKTEVSLFHFFLCFVPSKPMWLYLLCRTSASRCACLQGRGILCHQSVGSKYKLLQDKHHCSVTFSAAFISNRVNVSYGSNLWSLTCTSVLEVGRCMWAVSGTSFSCSLTRPLFWLC